MGTSSRLEFYVLVISTLGSYPLLGDLSFRKREREIIDIWGGSIMVYLFGSVSFMFGTRVVGHYFMSPSYKIVLSVPFFVLSIKIRTSCFLYRFVNFTTD